MQKKLLVEDKLTFQGAIDIAKSMELAAANTKQLQSQATVNKVTEGTDSRCYRCGKQTHKPSQCPYRGFKCHNCGKPEHLQVACRQQSAHPMTKGKGKRVQTRGRERGSSIRTVKEDTEESSESDSVIRNIRSLNKLNGKSVKPYIVEVQLDGKSLNMELDTGACISLVSQTTFSRLFPDKQLQPSTAHLSTYSGEEIVTVGEPDVSVSYKDQEAILPLVVVSGTGPSLLGRNWLSTLRLDWKSIRTVHCSTLLSQLLETYQEVFREADWAPGQNLCGPGSSATVLQSTAYSLRHAKQGRSRTRAFREPRHYPANTICRLGRPNSTRSES